MDEKKKPGQNSHPLAGEFSDLPDIPLELPILPMNNILIFPNIVAPMIINEERQISVINEALSDRKIVGLFAQKAKKLPYPRWEHGIDGPGIVPYPFGKYYTNRSLHERKNSYHSRR
jgi:ATP-dependent Lon protease